MKQKHTIQKYFSIRDFEEFNCSKKKILEGEGGEFLRFKKLTSERERDKEREREREREKERASEREAHIAR